MGSRTHDRAVGISGRALLLITAGALVGAVLALGAIAHVGPATEIFSSECSVGLAGTALSITTQGPDADRWCSEQEGTSAANGASWYRYGDDETLPGVLVCRQEYDGNTITVRDQGTLMLYGSEACASLQNSVTAFDASFRGGGSASGDSAGDGSGSDSDGPSDEGVSLDVDSDRYSTLMMEGVCLLTTGNEDEYVSVYTVGEAARTYCEGLIEQDIGGRDDWRVAQGYNGIGEQPSRVCFRDYDELIVEVFDTDPTHEGNAVCDALSGS